MSEQANSVLSLISTTLVSSVKVLELLQVVPFQQPLPEDRLREVVYLGYQPWAARMPDHVFIRSWQVLALSAARDDNRLFVPAALRVFAEEFLYRREDTLHVRREKFGAWQQSVVSRISGLPAQAAAWCSMPEYSSMQGRRAPSLALLGRSTSWSSTHMPLLAPHDLLVEDYIQREGLHETHLHLTGSTHGEVCWLRALHAPNAETLDFNQKWTASATRADREISSKLRELALTINPLMSPAELRRQLRTARRLREWLVAWATGAVGNSDLLPTDIASLEGEDRVVPPDPSEIDLRLDKKSCVADEVRWMFLLLRRLKSEPSVVFERMLHLYLLLQNQYYRLLVQSEEQFGFDQFQKLTFTDLREPIEKDYLNRFRAMHGRYAAYSRTGYLEGRFSPKQTIVKNEELMTSVLGGYWRYLGDRVGTAQGGGVRTPKLTQLLELLDEGFSVWSPTDRSHHRLALVAHFIKRAWYFDDLQAGPYRFYSLRKDVEEKAVVLVQTLRAWPRLHTWVRGIDAAANEIDAPPEVFASCYRICRHGGLSRRSYHAGEDFPHLLSGLRQMLDALELLELENGDRIGHGTAMGILPQLWLDRMPQQVVVRRGDWALDLLAAWRLLRRLPDATTQAYQIEHDLTARLAILFGRYVSCAAFERAMQLRHLNMRFLQDSREGGWVPLLTPLSDLWHAEALRVAEACRTRKQDVDLLWEWMSDRELWARSEAFESVDTGYCDVPTYVRLQQAIMREVAVRNVVIETLPSSNVRISHYHTFNEHHALRWMRVSGFMQEGDPEIMVSLGSDDPGIFAGDLNGEFYQLYSALRNEGLGDIAAMQHLRPLNERGRQYRFHDPSIG
jgi:adenosine deaminase